MFSSNTTQVSDGGYQISRSLRFNSADSAYLNRTPASNGNRQTWTLSVWVKRGSLGAFNPILTAGPVSPRALILLQSDDKLQVRQVDSTDTEVIKLVTTQVFRDPSAWYHIVVAQDTTQATSSNRVKLYVNGTQVTAFDTATYPTQNKSDLAINAALEQNYGRYVNSPSDGYLSAYLTETNFIDGTQLTPSSFGETNAQTGVWQPKAYSGSYGTNGFYLNFSDNSNTTAATLGKDYSGNGNNWTPNNFSVTAGAGNDSLVDSPTSYGTSDTGIGGEIRGNYSTFNPLAVNFLFGTSTIGVSTYTNGNLEAANTQSNYWTNNFASIPVSSGKWYAEFTPTTSAISGGTGFMCGVWNANTAVSTLANHFASTASGYAYFCGGDKINNSVQPTYGASFVNNDVIGVALDMDAGTLVFYKNGSSQGTAYTGLSGNFIFACSTYYNGGTKVFNAGQRPFAYTAPSGFKALCTQNLPTPTIGATTATQAGKFFNPVLYTGTGATNSITGVGFQPDWTWLKNRSAGNNHQLFDAVRGVQKAIYSDLTLAEATNANALTAFGSDGFTLGSESGINGSGSSFVSWNWKANGSGSSNTAGSITSTVSANTTSGFSVVTYTGQSGAGTVGHGLGVAPAMIIVKSRSNGAYGWAVWHSTFTQSEYLLMETTDVKGTASNYWNSSAPSTWTSAFGVGAGPKYVNNSGDTFVAYCFAQIAGYSAFGSYTGNGSTDGAFIYTGFRPAYVMIKRTDTSGEWVLKDTTRSPYNADGNTLLANRSDAEYGSGNTSIDELSNGFKCRTTSASANASGGTYVYMALASNPFKYSLAR